MVRLEGTGMNKETFLLERREWRDFWNDFFDRDSGDDIPQGFNKSWKCIVTCHATGCPNGGRSYFASIGEQLDGIYKVQCGMCLSAIDDLDPMLEDDEEFRLETRYPDGSSWLVASEVEDD